MKMNRIKNIFKESIKISFLILGIALTSYSWLTTFSDAPTIIRDWRIGVGIGLAMFFIGALWHIIELQGQYLWAQPSIEIYPSKRRVYSHGKFYLIAQLEVKNTEEVEVTDCYATLESASDVYWQGEWKSASLIPSLSHRTDRIKWVENEFSNERCEIDIPPISSRYLNLADTAEDFHYNLCSGKLSPNWLLGAKVHTAKIRIDGKLNGKAIKPQYFEGYFYYELRTHHFAAQDTSNGEVIGNVEGFTNSPFLIFGNGDWKKDIEIKTLISNQ